jgi:hypothetical protein
MASITRIVVLALALVGAAAQPSHAQSAEAEVHGVVQRLFDGMRAGDSTVVRSVFHPDARLVSVGVRNGEPMMRTEAIDNFVRAVGSPQDRVWDERIWDVEVRSDGNLATAWMQYAFYLGDTFSHCGVNAFQFFRDTAGWRVIQITDTRRREGCQIPDSLR